MARVTVEDCVRVVPNRFELILLSAHRARAISSGASILVERERDKSTVVALREIGDQKLSHADLDEDYISSLQSHSEVDELDAPESQEESKPTVRVDDATLTQEQLIKQLGAFSKSGGSRSLG